MLVEFTDYNGAAPVFSDAYRHVWEELEDALGSLMLHLKASQQAGIEGDAIFDPVGTNEAIKASLHSRGWASNVKIPARFAFLGKNIDFEKDGVIVEVQFSNYPFLLNNAVRSHLFYIAEVEFGTETTAAAVIITKAKMFPASQSTLYYEQAVNQLNELVGNGVFDIPIRLVGLFEEANSVVTVKWTDYGGRYSRTVADRSDRQCRIEEHGSRCALLVD